VSTPSRQPVENPLGWLHAPCVMGIVNVTPDSFSDGGETANASSARERIDAMAIGGAAICDIGAESTRPGAERVSVNEQLRRLKPLLDDLAARPLHVAISIDTTRAPVAAAALDAGAAMVNDLSAGRDDPDLLPLIAERGAAVCLMHMRGQPRDMQAAPVYGDVVAEVEEFLAGRLQAAVDAGIPATRVVLDPGIGFGKTLGHNLALLTALPRLARLGRPLLVGVSRKSLLGTMTGRPVNERLAASLAAGLYAAAHGAAVLRVHDVAETHDALVTWGALQEAGTK
jgi:dihydropteroate synthase